MSDKGYPQIQLLRAVHFAADRHRDQRRKGVDSSPYINHPIEVAETLAVVGGVSDLIALQAAILHDTIEDTDTSADELEQLFGPEVRALVEEVTDDKLIPKQERKQRQIDSAPALSARAKMIKLADKICNARDMATAPPADWSLQRRWEYLLWSEAVVAGCRGVNAQLELCFDGVLQQAREIVGGPP